MGQSSEHLRDRLKKLFSYAKRYKGLLAITLVMGVLGFAVTFVFPWLIGAAMDRVISPPLQNASPPSMSQRMHWLKILIIIGAATATCSAVAAYGRGHFTVKLGNRIITDLRQD